MKDNEGVPVNMKRLTQSFALKIILGLELAFLFATNRWMTFQGGQEFLEANDTASYRAIAEGFPSLPPGIPIHHLQRFFSPWLVGGVDHFFHFGVENTFRAF